MAIIHHQFESIHPFYDGNGRTGRIINILYLSLQKLLDMPCLYLSRYIIDNKLDYYKLLQSARSHNTWEDWILFMLKGVEKTARQTIALTQEILVLMQGYKQKIRKNHHKIYSQDLVNALFKHPYAKIDFLAEELQCSRQTAANYLNLLTEENYLVKEKKGKHNYYINQKLVDLFLNVKNMQRVKKNGKS